MKRAATCKNPTIKKKVVETNHSYPHELEKKRKKFLYGLFRFANEIPNQGD